MRAAHLALPPLLISLLLVPVACGKKAPPRLPGAVQQRATTPPEAAGEPLVPLGSPWGDATPTPTESPLAPAREP